MSDVYMGMSNDATFAGRLREHRDAIGITQEQLADRSGVSPHSIGKYERGERRPEHETADELAIALELRDEDRDEFMALARPPRKPVTLADRVDVLEAEIIELRDELARLVQSNQELSDLVAKVAALAGASPGGTPPTARRRRAAP